MMTKKETAADIIKTYFPKELSETIDTRTLKIYKDTFIDEQNAENESDILYEVMMDGKDAYIYLLFEHKSYDNTKNTKGRFFWKKNLFHLNENSKVLL
jgi:predicted transposase/invertase (TIGR01784 family)